ncbi:acylphosphatase [Infirmifilum lucidum]|uniref:Acylphosphatase n=1 Tax=Infirmifilum lucidum TaxID=2776706 RepID=A0A7L9FLT3_9CREN|nr:acylphosphatase [Infirmifilum lucidum]
MGSGGQGNVRAHVYVSGFVQGVGFRYSMLRVARAAGVRGWVRNLRDGRVEAVLEGPEDAVMRVIEWARRGPPGAWVERVEVVWEPYRGEFEGFEVVY